MPLLRKKRSTKRPEPEYLFGMFLSTIVDSTRRSRTAVQTAVIQIFGCLLNEKSLQPLGWKSATPGLCHGNPPHFKVLFQERVLNELIACVLLVLDEELGIIWFCAIFPRWFNILTITPPPIWKRILLWNETPTHHSLTSQAGFFLLHLQIRVPKDRTIGRCHHIYTSDHIRSNPFSWGQLFWARASQCNPVSIKFYTQVSWSGVTPQNLQLWSSPIFFLMVYILPT